MQQVPRLDFNYDSANGLTGAFQVLDLEQTLPYRVFGRPQYGQ